MSQKRTEQIERLTKDLWPDTGALVEQVLDASRLPHAWRPARAALATAGASRRWMTPMQFQAFLLAGDHLAKKIGTLRPIDALPALKSCKLDYLRGARPISKMHALAMAHFQAQFDQPIGARDIAAFDAWFTPRFGSAAQVERFLETSEGYISERVRGYAIVAGKPRAERLADETLVRALDWVHLMGPFCPWGEGQPIPAWPGQEV